MRGSGSAASAFGLLDRPSQDEQVALWAGELTGVVVRADALGTPTTSGTVTAVDAWIRRVVGARHPLLARVVCPFVSPALERRTLYYAPVDGCRSSEDVVAVMDVLVERFVALPPLIGSDTRLRTLVAIFVDVGASDGERIVIGAHRELKDRSTERGLMVGEFAPGYRLASTRDARVNVGESPVPVLVLRHMLPSDRRFLAAEDRWVAAWAKRFGADRVPLFHGISTEELAAVSRVAGEVTAKAGDVLCRQGDVAHELFLILEGEAVVCRNGQEVDTLGPHDHFGELALLTSDPRNATIAATTDMTLLVVGRREFRQVIDSVPALAHTLLAGLAQRLSQAYATSIQNER